MPSGDAGTAVGPLYRGERGGEGVNEREMEMDESVWKEDLMQKSGSDFGCDELRDRAQSWSVEGRQGEEGGKPAARAAGEREITPHNPEAACSRHSTQVVDMSYSLETGRMHKSCKGARYSERQRLHSRPSAVTDVQLVAASHSFIIFIYSRFQENTI